MNTALRLSLPLLALASAHLATAAESSRAANTVVLDAVGVKNLRIETAPVEETDFAETAFALGRIEARPDRVAALASRISGRVVQLAAVAGDHVDEGAELVRVESRQPGNPPPVIGLRAPLGGTVTRVDVRLGDPVEPDRALLEITDLAEVLAVARVPEAVAARLAPGATASITVAARAGEPLTGTLVRFGTAADPATGTIDAHFRLPNADGKLRPGMRAEFSLVLARRAGVLSVPRSALQGEPSARFVFVKDFDLPNAFVKSPVVVGQLNDRFAEIISGVLPADDVVTQGAYSLAFAGGGAVSLKDALDAAHGHEHAADGSELPANAKAATATAAGHDHDHDHDHEHEHADDHAHDEVLLWRIISGVLFAALVVVSALKAPRRGKPETA